MSSTGRSGSLVRGPAHAAAKQENKPASGGAAVRILTKRGYDFGEVSSAMQKAIPRPDTRLAGYPSTLAIEIDGQIRVINAQSGPSETEDHNQSAGFYALCHFFTAPSPARCHFAPVLPGIPWGFKGEERSGAWHKF